MKYWIVDFQHTSGGNRSLGIEPGIRCRKTCVSGEKIGDALRHAEHRICKYLMDAERPNDQWIITDIGIADADSAEHLEQIMMDHIADPDPELFEQITS